MKSETSYEIATKSDINEMNQLSRQKRLAYEKSHPQFWKWSGESAEKAQKEWFYALLENDKYICVVAKCSAQVTGFVIGEMVQSPQVYDPGGLTLMIDDFCVSNDNWSTIGAGLLAKIKSLSRKKGVCQMVVVSGDHDAAKKVFLQNEGLLPGSVWYVGGIT